MRRVVLLALALVSTLTLLAGPAAAQAPTPKVTITGFMDIVTSWARNTSIIDNNLEKIDTEWYARSRIRPDITAEVGTSKMVLGWEIDHTYGATGAAGSDTAAPQRFGETHSLDVNTDVIPHLELKWAYLEFDAPTGPVKWRWRVGAQPHRTTYKPGVLATGDFGGINWDFDITPQVKLHATFVQIEEESTGARDGFPNGEDYAWFLSADITPFKGFDIRPIVVRWVAEGTTSSAGRPGGIGGVSNAVAFFPAGTREDRLYLGVDARLNLGPFRIDPTVIHMRGTREIARFGAGAPREQDMSAWLVDVATGFQAGPLLLEARAAYMSGNSARHDPREPQTDIRYYQIISADGNVWGGWGEHMASNIDYLQKLRTNPSQSAVTFSGQTGYDKYGALKTGARASYAVTPQFTPRAGTLAFWTAHKVDTNGAYVPATGITTAADAKGDHSFLGIEFYAGFQYRFAPGIAFDAVYAYTIIGPAQAHALATANAAPVGGNGGAVSANNPNNVQSAVARIRYSF